MKLVYIGALSILALPVIAADRPPFYLDAGVARFDQQIRNMTRDYPWTIGLGWGESESVIFGSPSLDLEWAHAAGRGNKFDSYGVTYNERMMLSDSLYFGLGIGSYYNKIKAVDDAGTVYDGSRWFPAACIVDRVSNDNEFDGQIPPCRIPRAGQQHIVALLDPDGADNNHPASSGTMLPSGWGCRYSGVILMRHHLQRKRRKVTAQPGRRIEARHDHPRGLRQPGGGPRAQCRNR